VTFILCKNKQAQIYEFFLTMDKKKLSGKKKPHRLRQDFFQLKIDNLIASRLTYSPPSWGEGSGEGSLFVYNDLLNNLVLAVFKDHGINTAWYRSQVDHLLQ